MLRPSEEFHVATFAMPEEVNSITSTAISFRRPRLSNFISPERPCIKDYTKKCFC